MLSYDMYSVIIKGEIAIMTTTCMLDHKGFAFFFPHFCKALPILLILYLPTFLHLWA